jgi:hypothetical protein
MKLNNRDVTMWARGASPRYVNEILNDLWKASIGLPRIVPSCEDPICFDHKISKIYINPKEILETEERLERNGVSMTQEEIMSGVTAEEITHHKSYVLVPENFQRADYLGTLRTRSYADFLRAKSVDSQIEGVGYIGKRNAEEIMGIKGHDRADRVNVEEITAGQENTVKMLLDSGILNSPSKKTAANLQKVFSPIIMTTASCSGMNSIGKEMQSRCSDRLPELIRKSLHPSEKYAALYDQDLERYYPNLRAYLKELLA